MLDVPVVQIDPDLDLPEYAKSADAGVDLRSTVDTVVASGGGRALVSTGIAVAIPDGYAGFVHPRSGLALNHGITVLNSPGLIDPGYRGELKVLLINTDPNEDFKIERGERIAQLVIKAVEQLRFVVVDQLGDSDRGTGGFGHTGR